MTFVDSLLTAIVRADADALVMHAGEKPYVVTSDGRIPLSEQSLHRDAISSILTQLLSTDAQRVLAEVGAVEQEVIAEEPISVDLFSIVAAGASDDVWIEIRRHRRAQPQRAERAVAHDAGAPAAVAAAPQADGSQHVESAQADSIAHEPETSAAHHAVEDEQHEPTQDEPVDALAVPAPVSARTPTAVHRVPWDRRDRKGHAPGDSPVVVPLTRTLRIEVPQRPSPRSEVERLLVLAAERGASAVYLIANRRPFLRVDGDIRTLDSESELTSSLIAAGLLEVCPESMRDTIKGGDAADWTAEIAGIGRVRCTTFHDYSGPGALFQLAAVRPVSLEQLGFSREVQALGTERDGLVLIASPRRAGKSAIAAAFIESINRQRADAVIAVERQIQVVHASRQALVSQREARSDEEAAEIVRTALREHPDVLVIDDCHSAEVCELALDAASSGVLVVMTTIAGSTTAAVMRLVDVFPAEQRAWVLGVLGEHLRGVVAQVLLRTATGGRVAAREVLLANPAVATFLHQGQIAQLPLAIEAGARYGMVALNQALLGHVRSGTVTASEAYRWSADRPSLVSMLQQAGVDTAVIERLA